MTDIFISYSRKDSSLIESLAEFLTSRGYEVWWDRDISTGEDFRKLIREKLSEAKSVIVVWSQDSVKSEWVISEAQRASASGKFLPLRFSDLEIQDIPQPFDIRHTEVIENQSEILAALKKLKIEPSRRAKAIEVKSLDEVFRVADPGVTFIDRSQTPEAQRMLSEIRQGGRIVRFHGLSKSGKTLLSRSAFEDVLPVEIHGKFIKKYEDFFDHLSSELGLPHDNKQSACLKALTETKRPIIIDDFHRVNKKARGAIIER